MTRYPAPDVSLLWTRVVRSVGRSGAAVGLVLALGIGTFGCGDDPVVEESPYLPRTSPANVLVNIQRALERRDVHGYLDQLTPDFQVYVDPATRDQLGIEFWTASEESLAVSRLFGCEQVRGLDIEFACRAAPVSFERQGRACARMDACEVYLDITLGSETGSTTYRLASQTVTLTFCRGRIASIVDPGAPGVLDWYLAEWRIVGSEGSGPTPGWPGLLRRRCAELNEVP